MRVGYFGPEGTFTHEALIEALRRRAGEPRIDLETSRGARGAELLPLPTIYETVMAVHTGAVELALVPIENSLEGSVNATLDALAIETEDVAIVGEVVHPIRHCLIAKDELELDQIETVVSHPQATAQCARFIRTRLSGARVLSGSSTAEAVKMVAGHDGPWAALGNRLAAERYGCRILRANVEDVADNETRFVWLARSETRDWGAAGGVLPDERVAASGGGQAPAGESGFGATETGRDALGPWKTAIVFWGVGSDAPGWLVRCLSEFAARDVNLTRIESRPRKQGLGRYMFFLDLEGRDREPHVRAALESLHQHAEVLRVLGSFPSS
jgi:prephenate dehydratase